MKHIFSSLVVFLFIITTATAKIWRVNNNAGVPANFTTAQAAHDGAAAGDTLHFEPSPTSYGNLTMTKKLVLIGVGDFLDVNQNNQATNVTARLDNLTINAGADNSTVMVTAFYVTITGVQGVILQRCNVISRAGYYGYFSINLDNASNTVIRNCFLTAGSLGINGSTNVQIINNIIADVISMSGASSAIILNNIVNGKAVSGENNIIQNASVRNNIFNKALGITFSSCVVENNLTSNTTLPAGNGNQNSVNMTNVFINPNNFIDSSFKLKAGSPAIAAGVGGVDVGAYGGISPYRLSVQPNIPAIYKLVAPPVVSGGTITITVSTKSNN